MELLTDFILVGGIVITLIILWLLRQRSDGSLSHRVLSIFFVSILIVAVFGYAQLHRIKWLYAITFIPEDGVVWFLGPLLYLYVSSIFRSESGLVRRTLPHFIPFVIYTLVISVPLLISMIKGDYLFGYIKILSDHWVSYLIFIRGLFLLIYLVLSYRLMAQYEGLVGQHYSSMSADDLRWLKSLLLGVMIVISIDMLTEIIYMISGSELLEFGQGDGYLTLIAMVLFIGYLGYHGVRQSQVLLPSYLLQSVTDVPSLDRSDRSPTPTNALPDHEVSHIEESLSSLLEKEKPYLDPDLTLSKLAESINTTDKKLSTYLNQHLNRSFYDLINGMRVDEVKVRLASSDYYHYTLLGVAFDSGFKSKTSFNRIFKKEVGCSPSEYRKRCQSRS